MESYRSCGGVERSACESRRSIACSTSARAARIVDASTQLPALDPESLPAALPVAPDVDAAWHYDYRELGWTHQLTLPDLDGDGADAPLVAISGLPANVAPIVAMHHGLWIAGGGRHCRPGHHVADCWHRENLTITSHARLAELVYGSVGGQQVRLIRRGLAHATSRAAHWQAWDPDQRTYFEHSGHLLSLVAATHLPDNSRHLVATSGTIALAADPFVHRRMMAGAYQEIAGGLVRGLSGSKFLVVATALTQPTIMNVRRAGDVVRYRVAGRGLHLRPETMALGSMRQDKRLKTIARAAEEGSRLQDEWEMWLEGELLHLRRLIDRGARRPKVQGREAASTVPAGVLPDGRPSGATCTPGCTSGRRSCSTDPPKTLDIEDKKTRPEVYDDW